MWHICRSDTVPFDHVPAFNSKKMLPTSTACNFGTGKATFNFSSLLEMRSNRPDRFKNFYKLNGMQPCKQKRAHFNFGDTLYMQWSHLDFEDKIRHAEYETLMLVPTNELAKRKVYRRLQ